MNQQKTWLQIDFRHGKAHIEATLNYHTKKYSLTHSNNDQNVTFGKNGDDIKTSLDRAKCVVAALKFIEQELFNEE